MSKKNIAVLGAGMMGTGIAQLFGCSIATAQRIKSSGEIDDAISQVNGIIVVDTDYALDLLRVSKKYRNTSLRKSKK